MWNLLVGPVVNAVGGFFKGKQEIKKLKQEGEYKLARGEQVSKAEWEAMGVRTGQDSWKDEYVTLIVTMPIPFIFVGHMVAAFTGNTQILAANKAALTDLGVLMDTPYGQLMIAVCVAAIGIKWTKGMFK